MQRDISRKPDQSRVAFVVGNRFYFLRNMGLRKRARTVSLDAPWPGT
jgi:hypothetical protein